MALLSIPLHSWADIYKFTDTDGHVYYTLEQDRHALYKYLIKNPTKEKKAIQRERARQERQDYIDQVNATARFLDDVEAARKHRKHTK